MNSLTRDEIKRVVQLLGGEDALRAMIAQMRLPDGWVGAKHGDLTQGQIEALLNMMAEHAPALLSGEETMRFVKAVIAAFDRNGRRVPPRGLKSAVCDPDCNYFLVNPIQINYAERLARAMKHFAQVFGHDAEFCTADEYRIGSEATLLEVQNNTDVSNLANGPAFPIVLPRISNELARKQNLGQLVEMLVAVAKLAYEEKFSGRIFTNYRAGDLAGKVEVYPGSRQDDLMVMVAKAPVVGQQFFPFQGFSINADREQVTTMPNDKVVLSGIEIIIAWAFWPDVLLKNNTTIGYHLAGLLWKSSGYSLYGYAGDGSAYFARYDNLGYVDDGCSAGLFLPAAV